MADIDSDPSAEKQTPLNVVELLENIFVQLPITDVFKCQRVCHRWNATIRDSLPLMKKMWLVSKGSEILKPLCEPAKQRINGRSCVLLEKVPNAAQDLRLIRKDGTVSEVLSVGLELNNLAVGDGESRRFAVELAHALMEHELRMYLWHIRQPAWNRQVRFYFYRLGKSWWQHSWQRMLLTDPPCTSVVVLGTSDTSFYPVNSEDEENLPWSRAENPSGITLGDVCGAAAGYLKEMKRRGWKINGYMDLGQEDLDTEDGQANVLQKCLWTLEFNNTPT